MKRSPDRGVALPLLALFLSVLVLLIGVDVKRSLSGIAKIENQREADLLVLTALTERARALNAVAALNEGLEIALERGYAVGLALLTLEACTLALFSAPACAPALTKLGSKAVPFYRKLDRLGRELARMQEQISSWGGRRPVDLVRAFNLHPTRWGESHLFLYPDKPLSRLPIRRLGTDGFRSMGASSEEIGMAEGGDLRKCERSFYDTYRAFDRARKRGSIALGPSDSLSVEYADPANGARTVRAVRSVWELSAISAVWGGTVFQNATNLACRSLRDLLGGFGGELPVRVPPPMGLEGSFFQGGARLTTARVMKSPPRRLAIQEGLDSLLRRNGSERPRYHDVWALSEGEIDGGDLSKMEFGARMSRVTRAKEIWGTVRRSSIPLRIEAFESPPTWSPDHDPLRH